jgi:hypothetical protein
MMSWNFRWGVVAVVALAGLSPAYAPEGAPARRAFRSRYGLRGGAA